MQSNEDETSLKPITPDRDLYTIPHYSSWFSWDEIHDTEKTALGEFFDGTSFSKTPKIYKEYRDFIINKYREDPLRRLSFTEIRKSLIGDVFSIQKVFLFLENWGLINFRALSSSPNDDVHRRRLDVVYEDGPPYGIRVTADPNSLKPLCGSSSSSAGNEIDGADDRGGLRLLPLTSYSDIFGEMSRQRGLVCGNCGEECGSGYYESAKENFILCIKCYRSENFKGSHSADDFKFDDHLDSNVNHGTDAWTEAETMLLLEAVLKHGDDWDLITQEVGTKTKFDCISRLIHLPFGEHMLGSANSNGDNKNSSNHTSNVKPVEATSDVKPMEATSVDPHGPPKIDDQNREDTSQTEQIEKGDMPCCPLKRRCITSFADDAGSSLMKQVALLSTVVGPQVAAAAAEAAVAALCEENPCGRKIFDAEEDNITCDFGYSTSYKESERVTKVEDSETEEIHKQSETVETTTPEKNSSLSTLQVRAAIATALGAAAAHSKLLADQEDREIEHLMAAIIDTQMRKIQYKIKHFEELELIMEQEYSQIQNVKESVLRDRIDLLQRTFKAGISRRGDPSFAKCLTGTILY